MQERTSYSFYVNRNGNDKKCQTSINAIGTLVCEKLPRHWQAGYFWRCPYRVLVPVGFAPRVNAVLGINKFKGCFLSILIENMG